MIPGAPRVEWDSLHGKTATEVRAGDPGHDWLECAGLTNQLRLAARQNEPPCLGMGSGAGVDCAVGHSSGFIVSCHWLERTE